MPRAVIVLLAGCAPPPVEVVSLPGGTFVMGRAGAQTDESPAHRVTLSPFELDATLVTVARFRAWVARTGHVTSAERLGFGMVATEGMEDWAWNEVAGANWRQPWGPDSGITQGDDHPVVSVSWADADAYCRDHGRRLPTEAEWEYAMRAGREGDRFPWGDEPVDVEGRYLVNFWQGTSHREAGSLDGYTYTSPVRAFPPNAWGLFDPVGNTWQWTADWWAKDTYTKDAAGVVDPTGPSEGWARVARGGSWWCSVNACSAHGLWARGKSRPDAPYPNNGFRCAWAD